MPRARARITTKLIVTKSTALVFMTTVLTADGMVVILNLGVIWTRDCRTDNDKASGKSAWKEVLDSAGIPGVDWCRLVQFDRESVEQDD